MNLNHSFNKYKNCWLYNNLTGEKIFIKHIVYFEGSNEVKIYLFKDFDNNDELTLKGHEFINYIANYSKVKKKK